MLSTRDTQHHFFECQEFTHILVPTQDMYKMQKEGWLELPQADSLRIPVGQMMYVMMSKEKWSV